MGGDIHQNVKLYFLEVFFIFRASFSFVCVWGGGGGCMVYGDEVLFCGYNYVGIIHFSQLGGYLWCGGYSM